MKYINIKRIILNIALYVIVTMVGIAVYSACENQKAAYTTATIIFGKASDSTYFVNKDGKKIRYDEVIVEYEVENQKYQNIVFKLPDEYKSGDKIKFCYDKTKPSESFYNTLSGDLMFCGVIILIALGVVYACRSAFTGYKTDYLLRYKKAVKFSIISGLIPVLYWLWYLFIFEPGGEFLAGLGEFFMCFLLLAFVVVVNIIVWLIAAIMYVRLQNKK